MKKIMIVLSSFFLFSFSLFADSIQILECSDIQKMDKKQKEELQLDIYPTPQKGMEKHVIVLPQKEKEEEYRVELRFGKDKLVDCNHHSLLGGKLEEKTVASWGYSYYEFTGRDEMMQTMMYCPEEKIKKRVYYSIENGILNYSSKLPLVIYTPKDVKLEVHIWQHQETKSSR